MNNSAPPKHPTGSRDNLALSPFQRLIDKVCDVLRQHIHHKAPVLASVLCSWFLWLKNAYLVSLSTMTLTGRPPTRMRTVSRLLWGLTLLLCFLVAGSLPAIVIAWLWSYVRSHCI